jgi:hypothetical protein
MAEQSQNLLNFGNKQENNGSDGRGRLTAHEFNQVVTAINNNSNDVFNLQGQLSGLTLSVQPNQEAYEALEVKDANTIYLILDA